MLATHSVQKRKLEIFSESRAIQIARLARGAAARWESAVEEYCTIACGGSNEDARVVIRNIRKVVER